MRPRRSLRTSLTLWFVALAIAVVASSSAALYLGVRSSLLAGLDAELAARAEGVAALCEWEAGGIELEGAIEAGLDVPFLRGATAIEIRAWPSGELVRAFGPPLPPATEHYAEGARTFDAGGPQRLVTRRASLPSSPAGPLAAPDEELGVVVRMAGPLAPVHRALARLAWYVAGVIAVTALAVGAFGTFLARRVVRPIERLGAAAASVELGARATMPRRGTGDEVDRLAGVLDETFGALHAAMDEQRRFTADASHELRTPVSILQAESEIALRRERTCAEYADTLSRVHATAERMARILEALLTLTRLDAVHAIARMPVDLAALVLSAARGSEKDGKRIDVDVEAGVGRELSGDADLLGILLDNLVANARRHAAHRVEVTLARRGDGLELTVRDDGAGVPEHERGLLFERFYRGSNANGHPGAGLGLALVESIARAHGATCTVEDAMPGLAVRVRFDGSVRARRGG